MLDEVGGGFPAKTDAIGNADAVVGVSDETQAGQGRQAFVDPLDPLLVADRILRHGPTPARHLRIFGIKSDSNHRFTENVDQFMAHDRDSDTIYGYSEHYMKDCLPPVHAQAIKARGHWIPGEIDPASHNRNANDGERLFNTYKGMGMRIRKANNSVWEGITFCQERLETGRFKLYNTCPNFIKEFRLYRRDDKARIVKKDDHLMDAWRYGMMGIDHAMLPHMDESRVAPRTQEMTWV